MHTFYHSICLQYSFILLHESVYWFQSDRFIMFLSEFWVQWSDADNKYTVFLVYNKKKSNTHKNFAFLQWQRLDMSQD